jgi:hypothetical protein
MTGSEPCRRFAFPANEQEMRGAGILALSHTLLVVSLPRVYMGFHYPTDSLAGAVISVGLASGTLG